MLGAMRKHRRKLLVAVAVAITAAGVYTGYCLFWPRHRINRDSFAQIREGMTHAEVQAILGVPPGDYFSEDVHRLFENSRNDYVFVQPTGDGGWCAVWWSDAACVAVRFQPDGTVAEKGLWGGIGKEATLGPLDRLLWRLGL
jgi:outer membrane protein assembly factor BamE (lipoprotein component of BamABCDE complex)